MPARVASDRIARGGVEENLEELRPEEIDANNMRQDGANDRRARGGDEENLEELRQEGEDPGHEQGHQAEEQHHHHHAQGQQEGDHHQHHPLDLVIKRIKL